MNIINYIKAVAEAITGFNECVNFSQWVTSLRSHSNGTEKQELREDDVLKLQGSFHNLQDTLPAMYNFIDRVEWRNHEKGVAELLPGLKAAVYEAEDLLNVFRCYEQKVKIEGSVTSAELGTKFFEDLIQSNFNTKLTVIKNRLDNQTMMLQRMGLHQAILRFDRSVRPVTSRFPTDANIFGRADEIKKLNRLLGVPETANNNMGLSTRKRQRNDNTNATITRVPVLPIFGIGGVGKTTLAQNICDDPKVKSHFDKIAWICVSDDFDVKRLTKDAIEQFSGKEAMKDNLDSLQVDLTNSINKKRFLVVLDDMWAENEELWKSFYAPFKDVLKGSMMLVTTRSQKVANIVHTMDPFPLRGLKGDVFREFFELCVFGSDRSNINPELERIGEQILPKLEGSPLAAKTLGRLLGMSLDTEHWNRILSQLWEHEQQPTEIMPALRLSYIYLPFHLKRCFSFCAVYPKDYKFVKEDLAEIWVAEGFVESRCSIPLQQTGCEYFEELAHLSFFQKLHGKYVMHDLIHDMAQLVSNGDCFIIKDKKDLGRIPQKVRHLSVLKSRDVEWSDLENLCKQTKLRTLLCDKSLKGKKSNNVVEKWCAELLCMHVMVCASMSGLPDSISNMKNLRYLKICDNCHFDSLPAAFCHLYNLQVFSARKCSITVIPKGFSNLINLQKFELKVLKIDARLLNSFLLNSFNLITGGLYICNLREISKDQAAKIELMKKDTLKLTLDWSKEINLSPGPQMHNEIEVFQALQPPTDIKFLRFTRYPGQHFPSWFNGPDDSTIFSKLTELKIIDCPSLSSLTFNTEKFPKLKDLTIRCCRELGTLNWGWGWTTLEGLHISECPLLKWENGIALPPSLRTLYLEDCGYFSASCLENLKSLNSLQMIKCKHIERIPSDLWRRKLITLRELQINCCEDLVSIGGLEAIKQIPEVYIDYCRKLKEIQQPLHIGRPPSRIIYEI